MSEKKIKVLMGKPELEGHWRGMGAVSSALRDVVSSLSTGQHDARRDRYDSRSRGCRRSGAEYFISKLYAFSFSDPQADTVEFARKQTIAPEQN